MPNTEFLLPAENEEINNQKYLKILSDGKVNSIYDYLNNPITVFKNYQQIESSYKLLLEQMFEYKMIKM